MHHLSDENEVMQHKLCSLCNENVTLRTMRNAVSLAASTVASEVPAPVSKPKLSDILKFDGNPKNYTSFINAEDLAFLTHPNLFPNDQSKVLHILSNMTGDASLWSQTITNRNSVNHYLLNNYTQFWAGQAYEHLFLQQLLSYLGMPA